MHWKYNSKSLCHKFNLPIADTYSWISVDIAHKNRFNIYLTHKPSLFNILNLSGLVLSGHTHNGQIFPFNLIVKMKFPHVYGFFKKENTDLYVSSGSGCWGPRMRLGSNNEIIILEFM